MNLSRFVGRAFEEAERRRTHGDDAAALRPRGVQPVGRGGVDAAPFAVHDVAFGVLRLHGKKRAGADMKGEGFVSNARALRSEEHTSELQSLMRISYAVFCFKKKKK